MRDSVFFNKNLPKKLAVIKPIIINKIIKIIKPRPGTSWKIVVGIYIIRY